MAGNERSGKRLAFDMQEAELLDKIERYKQEVQDGIIPRASWAHFCGYLGYSEREVQECIKQGDDNRESAYYGRSVALKRIITWIRGEMLSGSGWSGQMQSKAIFALKQDFGDGTRYTDNDAKGGGVAEVKITFGGNDKRAKNAGK